MVLSTAKSSDSQREEIAVTSEDKCVEIVLDKTHICHYRRTKICALWAERSNANGPGIRMSGPSPFRFLRDVQLFRDTQKALLDSAGKLEPFINTIKGYNYASFVERLHRPHTKCSMPQNRTDLDAAGVDLFLLRCGRCDRLRSGLRQYWLLMNHGRCRRCIG